MKIICIGKNYNSNGDKTRPDVPLIFLKPDSAILPKDHPFFIPEFSNDITLEVELAVRICRLGKYISARFAHKYYDAYTAAVDFTAVDIMKDAQEKGFAEADPTADVEGIDVANKLSILMALAFDHYVPPTEIPTVGISKITMDDIKAYGSYTAEVKLHSGVVAQVTVLVSE
jgi:hypothetical protein